MEQVLVESVPAARWLGLIEAEYFATYLPAGGGAAKFVIAEPATAEHLAEACAALAHRHQMLAVRIGAGQTRLHMLQDVLFAISRALPWTALVQRAVEAMFARNGYTWPAPGKPVALADLAAHFGVAPPLVARNRDQWLSRDLWEDADLAQDFRAAIMHLSLAPMEPETEAGVEASPALQWLRGEKVGLAALRGCDIAARIGRTNARAMLASLCHWLRKVGVGGLALTLDLRPALRTKPGPEDTVRYSAAATMDLFEVLREIIDEIEHFPGLFVLGLADAALIAGDPKRTLDSYKALEMRIWPDVRPGGRQNPLAPLVTVGP